MKSRFASFLNRNLLFLFFGQIISQMGDSMYLIGLLWLVLDITGSKAAMGTIAMLAHLPMLVFGLFGGVLVDRWDRRRVMLGSDILRGAVVCLIPLLMLWNSVSISALFAITFLSALFGTVFNPARDALVPSLVAPSHLVSANALIQVSGYVAIFLGPVVASIILKYGRLSDLFLLDALSFAVSFGAVFFIRRYTQPPRAQNEVLWKQMKSTLNYLKHRPALRQLIMLTAINNFFIMGPAIVGIPVIVRDVLKEGASSYAMVESSLGVGMLAGSLLVGFLNRRMNLGHIWLAGMIFDGFTYILVFWISSIHLLMALIAIHALGIPMIVVSRTSIIQKRAEKDNLGRLFSLINVSVVGMTALTSAVVGWLGEMVPMPLIFLLFGSGGMLCGVWGMTRSSLRHI